MKKIMVGLLSVLMVLLFPGCSVFFEDETSYSDEENVSEEDTQTTDPDEGTGETDPVLQSAIETLQASLTNENYKVEATGEDKLKVSDGIYYVNVNEEESADDLDCYSLRVYTEATDDPDADSEGTIARYYVAKSTGTLYLMDSNEGTMSEFTAN